MTLRTLIYSSILSLALPATLSAQLRCPPIAGGFNEGKIDVTIGAGQTMLYGDINTKSNWGYGLFLRGDYLFYKGFYAGVEAQVGTLNATGVKDLNSYNWDPREAHNNYFVTMLTATFYPYRFLVDEKDLARKGFLERHILNGFHVGVGAGLVFNHYTFVNHERNATDFWDNEGNHNRVSDWDINGPHDLVYDLGIDESGNEVPVVVGKAYKKKTRSTLFPVIQMGLSIPINKNRSRDGRYLSGVLRTQFNFAVDENLDGYDPLGFDGTRRSNARYDMYNFTALGLKYTF